MALTLDITELQVALHFPDDELNYHHRILLKRLDGPSWIVLTPDFDLERVDLGRQAHTVLERNQPFPDELAHSLYAFDPISRQQLNTYKRRAALQAAVFEEDPAGAPQELVWAVSEAGSPALGRIIDPDEMDHTALLETKGVVVLDGEETFVVRIPRDD
eukprot:1846897-Lingulodinium_polyedra.AAC.1